MMDIPYRIPPRTYQIEGSQTLVEQPVFALWDDMGLGKSKQLIDAVCQLYTAGEIEAVLIVCPSTLKSNWAADPSDGGEPGEIRKHGWETIDHIIYEMAASKKPIPVEKFTSGLIWCVVNYQAVWRSKISNWLEMYMRRYRTAMVLDEAHNIKTPSAQQTRGCLRLGRLAVRRYCLTGTPQTKSPLDLYSQFGFLDTQILGYQTFRQYKNDIVEWDTDSRIRDKRGNPVVVKGFKNLDQILAKIAPFYLRRTKEDHLDIPPKTYVRREIALNAEQEKAYKSMAEKMYVEFQEKKFKAPIALTKVLRLIQISSGFVGHTEESGEKHVQFLGSTKAREAAKIIAEEHEGQALVFFQQHAELELLRSAMNDAKIPYLEVTGTIDTDMRRKHMDRFQTDPGVKALLCQIQVSKEGLTLTAANLAIFMSNSYNYGHRTQSEDRIHRIGQESPVTYIDLLSTYKGRRTIDHEVLNILLKKGKSVEEVIKDEEDLRAFLLSLQV